MFLEQQGASHKPPRLDLLSAHPSHHNTRVLTLALIYALKSGHISPYCSRIVHSTDERMRPSRYELRLPSDAASSDSLSSGSRERTPRWALRLAVRRSQANGNALSPPNSSGSPSRALGMAGREELVTDQNCSFPKKEALELSRPWS